MDKEKHHVNFRDEEADNEEGNKICVAEWVEKPRDKPRLFLEAQRRIEGGDEIHF
jgi:hypothetical protein